MNSNTEIDQLEAEVAFLKAELSKALSLNTCLQARLYRYENSKSSCNSSIPPSRDFEDIIYVLDNNDSITGLAKSCINTELKKYLKEQYTLLINKANIAEHYQNNLWIERLKSFNPDKSATMHFLKHCCRVSYYYD